MSSEVNAKNYLFDILMQSLFSLLFAKPEEVFDFLPETLSKDKNAHIECYLTYNYQSGYNTGNLTFCISKPGYYQDQEKGYCR